MSRYEAFEPALIELMAIAFEPVGIDCFSWETICAKSLSKPAKNRCCMYDPAMISS